MNGPVDVLPCESRPFELAHPFTTEEVVGLADKMRGRRRAALLAYAQAIQRGPLVAELIEAAKRVSDVGRHADFVSGVCCCGDSIDRHAHPMNSDHAPVDTGERYGREALDSLDAALANVGGAK